MLNAKTAIPRGKKHLKDTNISEESDDVGERLYCIYLYTNPRDKKKYVGRTVMGGVKNRMRQHVDDMLDGSDTIFHQALYQKFGHLSKEDAAICVYRHTRVLERNIPKQYVGEREDHYINEYDTLYNDGTGKGYNMRGGG